jgi:hypothetical protein
MGFKRGKYRLIVNFISNDFLSHRLSRGCVHESASCGLGYSAYHKVICRSMQRRCKMSFRLTDNDSLICEYSFTVSSPDSINSDKILRDRQKSPTWITTTPLATPEVVYCKFLTESNWTRVYLLHDLSALPYYLDTVERVAASLKNCNIQYTEDIFYSNKESFQPMETVRKFNENSRGE